MHLNLDITTTLVVVVNLLPRKLLVCSRSDANNYLLAGCTADIPAPARKPAHLCERLAPDSNRQSLSSFRERLTH